MSDKVKWLGRRIWEIYQAGKASWWFTVAASLFCVLVFTAGAVDMQYLQGSIEWVPVYSLILWLIIYLFRFGLGIVPVNFRLSELNLILGSWLLALLGIWVASWILPLKLCGADVDKGLNVFIFGTLTAIALMLVDCPFFDLHRGTWLEKRNVS